jgi:steroid delta-isomerase-like uncharacterized protein
MTLAIFENWSLEFVCNLVPAIWCLRRRLLGQLLASCLLIGCTRSDPQMELAQRWLDALNAHDADAVVRLLQLAATYQEGGMPAPMNVAELRQWLAVSWRAWPDQVYAAKRIVAGDGTLVIEWHVQQTHTSGKALPLDGVTLLDVRDGQIAGVRLYYDRSGYLGFLKR